MPDRDTSRIALFIAILAGFMTPFDLSAVNIALPAIGSQFSMDAVSLSWVSTAYLLASAVFLVPFGRIADIHGRKKIFTIGLAIFTLTSLALVFSPTSLALIILRFVQGAGAALIFGTAVAILTSVTPPRERGKAIGILYHGSVYRALPWAVSRGDPDRVLRVAQYLPGQRSHRSLRHRAHLLETAGRMG